MKVTAVNPYINVNTAKYAAIKSKTASNAQSSSYQQKSSFGLYNQDIKCRISFGNDSEKLAMDNLREKLTQMEEHKYFRAGGGYVQRLVNRFNNEEIENIMQYASPENLDVLDTLLKDKAKHEHTLGLSLYDDYFYDSDIELRPGRFSAQNIVQVLNMINNEDKKNLKTPLRDNLSKLLKECTGKTDYHSKTLYKNSRFNEYDIVNILGNINSENEDVLELLLDARVEKTLIRFEADEIIRILRCTNDKNKHMLPVLLEDSKEYPYKERFDRADICWLLNRKTEGRL